MRSSERGEGMDERISMEMDMDVYTYKNVLDVIHFIFSCHSVGYQVKSNGDYSISAPSH